VIVTDVEPLPPAEAAWRASGGARPTWLCLPGTADPPAALAIGVGHDVVACDPVAVVRAGPGGGLAALDRLEVEWQRARARWASGRPEVPIGVAALSYELGRSFEPVLGPSRHASQWPEVDVCFYDALWIRDARNGRARIVAATEEARRALVARLSTAPSARRRDGAGAARARGAGLAPLEPPEAHLAGVAAVLDYIHAGDVYQVNLARRLHALLDPTDPLGLGLFARLRDGAPAPHALWLADAETGRAIVGNSPERLLRADGRGAIETFPIKGTRSRAVDPEADRRAAAELRTSTKDAAEHAMIVDLERNDLGRVCEVGSVHVAALGALVSLPTVHHLVSRVAGRLRPDVDLSALLRATFPGGSITGAPKIRAMQIIDELEPGPRGPYCGATGWLGAAGDLDLAVAIRTARLEPGGLTLWTGGGVVADSTPASELAETTTKAAAFALVL
jgi:para-aminobenzoate synthetase component 1